MMENKLINEKWLNLPTIISIMGIVSSTNIKEVIGLYTCNKIKEENGTGSKSNTICAPNLNINIKQKKNNPITRINCRINNRTKIDSKRTAISTGRFNLSDILNFIILERDGFYLKVVSKILSHHTKIFILLVFY